MRSKHSRLQIVFPKNGARRCDYEALIDLAFQVIPERSLAVSDFEAVAREVWPDFDYKQLCRVLSQMADDGQLWRATSHGIYMYLPIDTFPLFGDTGTFLSR